MIGGRSLRVQRATHHSTQRPALVRRWTLPLLSTIYIASFWIFFVVMHLQSQFWAKSRVLEPLTGYWRWFFAHVFSYEQVYAVRRSPEAAWHPWLMLATVALMGGMYVWLLSRLRNGTSRLTLQAMIGLVLLVSVPLLLLPNLQSGDVYSYIAYGRIAALFGGNPFIQPPSAFGKLDSTYVGYVNWKNVASVYGPVWIYLSMVLTTLVEAIHSHVIAYVLSYKLFAMALHIVNGCLIWSILGRLRPEQQQWGTALYLLCPLALVEFVGNAHNDVLMITFILLALWLHVRAQWPWAITALTFAVLTKWIALLILPLYGLVLLWEATTWRERVWRAGVGLALFTTWCVLLYSPYWEGTKTLRILADAPPQKRLINSLGDIVRDDTEHYMASRGLWPDAAILDSITIFNTYNTPATAALAGNPNAETDNLWRQQANRFIQERTIFRNQALMATANREWLSSQIRDVALGILALACVAGAALTRSLQRAILVGAWLFWVYCSISAVWFWPWYLTWFVALAALLDWRVTGRTAVLASVLAPMIYVFYPSTVDPTWWQRYRAALVFVPPLMFVAWQAGLLIRANWRRWLGDARTALHSVAGRRWRPAQQD